MTPERSARLALGTLAAHNLVQNHLLNERGYVAGNLVVSALLVGLGRGAGLSWDAMGLRIEHAGEGLRAGALAAVGVAGVATSALLHPRSRRYLRDERAVPSPGARVWSRAAIRFPLGTALFEEVVFRGVLPSLLRRDHRPMSGELRSAGCFALWHLIPTARAISGNPLGIRLSVGRRTLAVITGSAMAGIFGLGFSAMRRRTGSLLAPWLAHASLNSLTYLAGVTAWKAGRPGVKHRAPG